MVLSDHGGHLLVRGIVSHNPSGRTILHDLSLTPAGTPAVSTSVSYAYTF